MFNRLIKVEFLDNLIVHAEFQSGEVMEYNFHNIMDRYPVFNRLKEDESLFKNGHVRFGGIIFDDELDIAEEELYYNGRLIEVKEIDDIRIKVGNMISKAREDAKMTQTELARKAKIHQSDLSDIERGVSNPSVKTLDRIAKGLGLKLELFLK
ncbi:MAG: helix-turn-helix domain-containing protein [bacterium]|nr:helix-turn-helix domain-containing protein [bacterium]